MSEIVDDLSLPTLRALVKKAMGENKALRARIEQLEAALREIAELPGEINPSNYTHDDVIALNDANTEAWAIACAALGEKP
jgi:hypothetical protein